MCSASQMSRPSPQQGTDSASQPQLVITDCATITKVKVGFAINYVYVPATTTHDW